MEKEDEETGGGGKLETYSKLLPLNVRISSPMLPISVSLSISLSAAIAVVSGALVGGSPPVPVVMGTSVIMPTSSITTTS